MKLTKSKANHCVTHGCDYTNDSPCTTCGEWGSAIVLDVVAEPDIVDISACTGTPSETVQAEVTSALARSEVAETRRWAADEAKYQQRVSRALAAERAHSELYGHAVTLECQLRDEQQALADAEWRLTNQQAWVAELTRLANDAQRAAGKALERWHRMVGS